MMRFDGTPDHREKLIPWSHEWDVWAKAMISAGVIVPPTDERGARGSATRVGVTIGVVVLACIGAFFLVRWLP